MSCKNHIINNYTKHCRVCGKSLILIDKEKEKAKMSDRWMIGLNLKNKKEQILKIAQALANETRLDILQALKDHREINHRELAEKIGKTPATVSSHMKYLIRAGILEDVKLKGLRGRIKKVPRYLINEIVIKL